MKRVLFVASVVKTHINAFHLPYLKWWKEQGYEVHVCAKNDYNGQPCVIPYCDCYYDIPFERNPMRRENIGAYKMLKAIVDRNNYDLIHCHTPVGGALTRWAARCVRKRGTKVLYTAHGFHFYKGAPLLNWLIYYPVERFLANFTDVLITINREDWQIAKRFSAGRIEYVPGVGVDIERFNYRKEQREDVRKKLGIKENTVILLSVGELIPRKSHSCAIEAVTATKHEDITYLICGDGELRERLQNQIDRTAANNYVRLMGFRTDVADLYAAADIFLFPSRQEGLPVALMEAMASGMCCIATDVRGNRDLIKNENNGLLVPLGDTEAMCAALNKAIQDTGLRRRLGRSASKDVMRFSLGQAQKSLCEIYSQMMGTDN